MPDPALSAPGHRNGCQGCDHDPACFPPCWTDDQVTEAQRQVIGQISSIPNVEATRQESLALSRAERTDVERRAERLAQQFHETYERLAPSHGYETRKASAVPWHDVPEQNKRLMIDVCVHLIETGSVHAALSITG